VHGLLSSGDEFGDGVCAFAGAHDDQGVADGEAEVGVGDGTAAVRRRTATMDAPVRERAWVAPSVQPAYGDRLVTGICSVTRSISMC
jgi:hypothetical protein